jgi:hypothetical protein
MQKFLFVFLFACTLVALNSCSRSISDASAVDKTQYVIVMVSGFDSDPTPEQIAGTSIRGSGNSGMFQLMADLEELELECKFFNWNGTEAGQSGQENPPGIDGITNWIEQRVTQKPETEFVFVGHSWGGHTVISVASQICENSSVRFPFTVFLDASSALRGTRPAKLPDNIEAAANFHTGNMFCWGALKNAQNVENISLGDSESGFMENDFPKYGSAFDISAHNYAEWDQNIHREIIHRILKVVKASP